MSPKALGGTVIGAEHGKGTVSPHGLPRLDKLTVLGKAVASQAVSSTTARGKGCPRSQVAEKRAVRALGSHLAERGLHPPRLLGPLCADTSKASRSPLTFTLAIRPDHLGKVSIAFVSVSRKLGQEACWSLFRESGASWKEGRAGYRDLPAQHPSETPRQHPLSPHLAARIPLGWWGLAGAD